MAAVVAFAAPLFLLACIAIFQSPDGTTKDVLVDRSAPRSPLNSCSFPDYRDKQGPPSNIPTPDEGVLLRSFATERILMDVLLHCDVNYVAFLGHRALVEKFIAEATAQLIKLSPILANVTVHHDGSAFEGTRTTDSADFDTYALLSSEKLLSHFELHRGTEGRIAARLRPGVTRGALPTDLTPLVTGDGYLDARLFKRWVFGRLETALRRAEEAYPNLRPVVYSTHGAAGANLTAPDGTLLQVDFTAQLAPPPTKGVLRPKALRPCGLRLVPPGRAAPWSVYSSVDLTLPPPAVITNLSATSSTTTATDSASAATATTATDDTAAATEHANDDDVDDAEADTGERWFVINTMKLEGSLLSAQPLLRNVIRLLKSLSTAHRWEERFHVASFILKHAVFWTFAEGCETEPWRPKGGLLSPTVASLRTLESALRSGRMDKFFVGSPAGNALSSVAGRPAMMRLAEEIHGIVGILLGRDHDAIRSVFRI